MMERGTMLIETALKKLSKSWRMYKRETQTDGTVKVVENGVQVLVEHDEWAEIIKAIYFAQQEVLKKDPSVPGVEKAATVPGVIGGE